MSDKPTKKPELSYSQFTQMCEDAGIRSNTEEMEQDYRTGAVLADVVDGLMNLVESEPPYMDMFVGHAAVKECVNDLWEAAHGTSEDRRKAAISVAAAAIKYAADLCHDEGNN